MQRRDSASRAHMEPNAAWPRASVCIPSSAADTPRLAAVRMEPHGAHSAHADLWRVPALSWRQCEPAEGRAIAFEGTRPAACDGTGCSAARRKGMGCAVAHGCRRAVRAGLPNLPCQRVHRTMRASTRWLQNERGHVGVTSFPVVNDGAGLAGACVCCRAGLWFGAAALCWRLRRCLPHTLARSTWRFLAPKCAT